MKKTGRKDLFPGALEMMILQTLQREPLHGYALVQHIKRASNDLLQVEEGSSTRHSSACSRPGG